MQISGRICYLQLKLSGVRRRVNQTKHLVWKPLELMTYSGVLESQLTSFSKRFLPDWGDSGR